MDYIAPDGHSYHIIEFELTTQRRIDTKQEAAKAAEIQKDLISKLMEVDADGGSLKDLREKLILINVETMKITACDMMQKLMNLSKSEPKHYHELSAHVSELHQKLPSLHLDIRRAIAYCEIHKTLIESIQDYARREELLSKLIELKKGIDPAREQVTYRMNRVLYAASLLQSEAEWQYKDALSCESVCDNEDLVAVSSKVNSAINNHTNSVKRAARRLEQVLSRDEALSESVKKLIEMESDFRMKKDEWDHEIAMLAEINKDLSGNIYTKIQDLRKSIENFIADFDSTKEKVDAAISGKKRTHEELDQC